MPEQGILPTLDAPVLAPGPVFLAFEIAGKPQHKARHRSRIVYPRGGNAFIHNYPDPDTAAYEKILAEYASLLMRGRTPSLNPLAMLVHAFVPIPASWTARDKLAAEFGAILPTTRPDGDNFFKAAADSLNGIVFKDDSQIVDGRVIKRYAARPALRIEVREFLVLQHVGA